MNAPPTYRIVTLAECKLRLSQKPGIKNRVRILFCPPPKSPSEGGLKRGYSPFGGGKGEESVYYSASENRKSLLRQLPQSQLFKAICFFCCILLLAQNSWAQDTPAETFDLIPLDQLLSAAQQHSPLLKMEALDAELLHSELKLLKKEWSNYVSLSASFQVGNVQFIDNLSGGNTPDVRTVTRENVFAVTGVTIRLPLSDFITKPERRRHLQLQLEQQRFDEQQKIFELRQLVIRQYNDLQRALRILEIRNRDLNFHILASETAERFFREGDMKLDEYTGAFNKRNEAEVRLEETKLDAQLLYLLLRELVGTEIKANG